MSEYMTEKEVLNKLNIENFRQVTKDKVIALASMLDKMDPEVAKKALEQFPDFSRTMRSLVSDYKEIISEAIDTNRDSVKSCYASCNTILEILKAELENENLDYIQRKEILELMISVNKMIFEKDTENKHFILKIVGEAAALMIGVGIIMLSALGCNAKINMNNTL